MKWEENIKTEKDIAIGGLFLNKLEKSDKFLAVQSHYASLLIQAAFEQALKKVSILKGKKSSVCRRDLYGFYIPD